MRSKTLRTVIGVALAALGVSGLAAQPSRQQSLRLLTPGPRTARTQVIDVNSAYTERRRIGRLAKPGACPEVAGWEPEPLLTPPRATSDRSLFHAAGLDR